jgi:phenylalanyl-tRNA synthetase beta chain
MKLSAQWIRDFVDLPVDDRRLAEDLTAVGIAVEGIRGSGTDSVLEMEIGTNRPDAMNHYGVAREGAAIYDLPLKPLSAVSPQLSAAPGFTSGAKAPSSSTGSTAARKRSATQNQEPSAAPGARINASGSTTEVVPFPDSPARGGSSQSDAFPITVEEPELCPRFSARMIRGTHVKPSPEKIAHRLQLIDQRPISNVVDATNYVLWEMGKPTHVFDMDLLKGGRLIIRRARDGEKLKTLDGVERTLTSEDLVVADAKRPVGLAGVMGGFDTMITDKTKNILIESAWWDPLTVRKTARRHGIHTDASHRFERGADFESTVLSCDLVAQIILASGGGKLLGDVMDVVSKKMDQAPVILRLAEVHRILGGNLEAGEIFRILKRLGFESIPEGEDEAQFEVHIPSWRLDVEREIDLIEEIARLHGYDKFENTLPAYRGTLVELPNARADATVRERALALGYNEAVSLSFVSHEDAERFESALENDTSAAKAAHQRQDPSAAREALRHPKASLPRVLELENPLSAEASVMRTTLVPGMLEMLAWNLHRDSNDARLFEMGRVYETREGERFEPERLCLGATASAVSGAIPAGSRLDVSTGNSNSPPRPEEGLSGPPSASTGPSTEEFRAFKGDVENLLTAFDYDDLTFDRQTAEYFHPGRSARALMDGVPVAHFGQVADDVKVARKLRQDVYLAEIDLEPLHARGLRRIVYKPLPKYPGVERDFSFVFSDEVEFGMMRRAVMALRIPELREFTPVEVFRGGSIAAGKYSILLRARLQSDEGTLRDEPIAAWSQRIVGALQELGGMQRA